MGERCDLGRRRVTGFDPPRRMNVNLKLDPLRVTATPHITSDSRGSASTVSSCTRYTNVHAAIQRHTFSEGRLKGGGCSSPTKLPQVLRLVRLSSASWLPFLLPRGTALPQIASGGSTHWCPLRSSGEGGSHKMGSPLTLLPAPAPKGPG